ncbi:unnamed protein product [Triticum turgidum subsp. durum]|uniref:Uncharacterized protein n=2 Tax=Triticum TaxID=4564 RepID=A0A9R1QUA2_TRITD|nr:unnamed protein product [Triticum aestivum]VAH83659.1 unnamed protein product [Triticum turgidum subsp. durum]
MVAAHHRPLGCKRSSHPAPAYKISTAAPYLAAYKDYEDDESICIGQLIFSLVSLGLYARSQKMRMYEGFGRELNVTIGLKLKKDVHYQLLCIVLITVDRNGNYVEMCSIRKHIEALEEIDMVYKKELALQSGIKHRGGIPSLGGELTFISDHVDVTKILPYVAVSNRRGSLYACGFLNLELNTGLSLNELISLFVSLNKLISLKSQNILVQTSKALFNRSIKTKY